MRVPLLSASTSSIRAFFDQPENREVVRALNAAGCETSYVSIETDKGHDAFFVEEPEFEAGLRGFIDAAADARGLGRIK